MVWRRGGRAGAPRPKKVQEVLFLAFKSFWGFQLRDRAHIHELDSEVGAFLEALRSIFRKKMLLFFLAPLESVEAISSSQLHFEHF